MTPFEDEASIAVFQRDVHPVGGVELADPLCGAVVDGIEGGLEVVFEKAPFDSRLKTASTNARHCADLWTAGDRHELGRLGEEAVPNRCYEVTDNCDVDVMVRVQALGYTAFDTVFDGDDTSVVGAVRDCLDELRDRCTEVDLVCTRVCCPMWHVPAGPS